MAETHTIARQIQQLEIYLNSLVSSLTRGELPVNLKPVTQIFNDTIVSIPPILNLPIDRFVEIYNDIPHLFTAYAIDVTLSEESYFQQSNYITFQRLSRGNYWILPTQASEDKAWLVPNPLKSIALNLAKSLEYSFDRDFVTTTDDNSFSLVTPALVQRLPIIEPLSWKLLERGKISKSQKPVEQDKNTALSIAKTQSDLLAQTELTKSISTKQEVIQSIVSKVADKVEAKNQELVFLRLDLDNSIDKSTQQSQEIAWLRLELDRLKSSHTIPTASTATSSEIVSLKIDLEKLKADYQRQQKKKDQDIAEQVRLLVQAEMTKLRSISLSQATTAPTEEIIESEIIETVHQRLIPDRVQAKVENIQLSPIAKIYNSGEKNFLRSYQIIEASIRKPRTIISTIELVEDRIGLYWIMPFENNTCYLVPKIGFPIEDIYLEGLMSLFDGVDSQSNFSLFKPAIVTLTKPSMPKQWKLEQKGLMQN
jgi:hypothetical protein